MTWLVATSRAVLAFLVASIFILCSWEIADAGGGKSASRKARNEAIRQWERQIAAQQKPSQPKATPVRSEKARALNKEALRAEIAAQKQEIVVQNMTARALLATYVAINLAGLATPGLAPAIAGVAATPAAVGATASATIGAIAQAVDVLSTVSTVIEVTAEVIDGVQ